MWTWIFVALTTALYLLNLTFSLIGTPLEKTQGVLQKIFYFHVPAAFSTYLFLVVGAALSIFYLSTKNIRYHHLSRASLYTSTLFASLVIGSGPLWAKPIWGVYWTWDPRLTLTFILFILLLGYCFVQSLFGEGEAQTRKAALIGSILAVLALPFMVLTHLSVRIWRGLHPSVLSREDGLAPEFRTAFELSVFSTFLLGGLICFVLYRYLKLKQEWEATKVHFFERSRS